MEVTPVESEPITSVVIHPLVLLSVTDHIVRIGKISKQRVVGILLGSEKKGKVDCISSFAVPFDENESQGVWYIDFDYLDKMIKLLRKVNENETVVGFYSSNPKVTPLDIEIDMMIRRYTPHPVFVTMDIDNDVGDLPCRAFISEELTTKDTKDKQRIFKHIDVSIESLPVEEIGVEYMLKNINNPTLTSLSEQIKDKIIALKGLSDRLQLISTYLTEVGEDMTKYNVDIMYEVQNILNLLPNLQVESLNDALITKTNEFYMLLFLSTMIRSLIPIYELLKKKEAHLDELLNKHKDDGSFQSKHVHKKTLAEALEEEGGSFG